eukprot:COSAG01_NODE_693_length_14202_cov_11.739491_4_plen_102_part_00
MQNPIEIGELFCGRLLLNLRSHSTQAYEMRPAHHTLRTPECFSSTGRQSQIRESGRRTRAAAGGRWLTAPPAAEPASRTARSLTGAASRDRRGGPHHPPYL